MDFFSKLTTNNRFNISLDDYNQFRGGITQKSIQK